MALDTSLTLRTRRAWWFGDFRFERGRVFIAETGVWIRNDLQLWGDALRWFTYYLYVRCVGSWSFLTRRTPRLYFAPMAPRPWYIVWAACVWAGVRVVRDPKRADAAFYFEDQTIAAPPPPLCARHFNYGVGDVSKSYVAAMNEAAFAYPLALDPETHAGDAVEKSEGNGLHDGRLIACPAPRVEGKSYQRVIRTEGDDGWAVDLRTACVGRKPVVVFVKTKPAAARFSIQNTSVVVKRPEEVYAPAEIAQIERFCEIMQLDWGGLDVLRERESGRLYVVDVNKTDTGPAVVLNWRDRTRATQWLAEALVKMISGAGDDGSRSAMDRGGRSAGDR